MTSSDFFRMVSCWQWPLNSSGLLGIPRSPPPWCQSQHLFRKVLFLVRRVGLVPHKGYARWKKYNPALYAYIPNFSHEFHMSRCHSLEKSACDRQTDRQWVDFVSANQYDNPKTTWDIDDPTETRFRLYAYLLMWAERPRCQFKKCNRSNCLNGQKIHNKLNFDSHTCLYK